MPTLDYTQLVKYSWGGFRQWPQYWGAIGDGATDDTVAVQNWINYLLTAASTSNLEKPPYTGIPGTGIVPVGTYLVNEISIPGTVHIMGQGGGTYANATFLQKTAGQSIFRLKGANPGDGVSNSSVFDYITFKSASGSSSPTVAQIICDASISTNSVYIRNCWFKSPETWAIWMLQGDDLQISGCTFDVSAFHAIRLGNGASNKVTNCGIKDNTFYNVALDHIRLENVMGVVIGDNRAYGPSTPYAASVFVNGTGASSISAVSIGVNELNGLRNFCVIPTIAGTIAVVGNVLTNVIGNILKLVGGGILYNLIFMGNAATTPGAFDTAPFLMTGCGLQQSVITANSILAGATTPLMIDASDARVTGNNMTGNVYLRFTATHNLASIPNNTQTAI